MNDAGWFTSVAREYANHRPGYPPALFAYLARVCSSHGAAWDCGAGSGQASVPLATHFDRVYATDVAREQIDAATPHPRVSYHVAPAASSGLEDASVDLVTVAQALHWFDLPAFYAEVRRVLRPGGVLAVWTYPRPRFEDATLDARFHDFHSRVVGPWWPPERRHVDAEYATLEFPPRGDDFEELAAPEFGRELQWTLEQVLGYAASWSATTRYRSQMGADPVPRLREALAPAWPADGVARVRMPLVVRAARLAARPAEVGS